MANRSNGAKDKAIAKENAQIGADETTMVADENTAPLVAALSGAQTDESTALAINLDTLTIPIIASLLYKVIARHEQKGTSNVTVTTEEVYPLIRAIHEKGIARPCSYSECPYWRREHEKDVANNIINRLVTFAKADFALLTPEECDILNRVINCGETIPHRDERP